MTDKEKSPACSSGWFPPEDVLGNCLPVVEQRPVPAGVDALEAEFATTVKDLEKAIAARNVPEMRSYAGHLIGLVRIIDSKRSQAATGGNEKLSA